MQSRVVALRLWYTEFALDTGRKTPSERVGSLKSQPKRRTLVRLRAGIAAFLLAVGWMIYTATPAAAIPAFQMPFPCGEVWRASTYSGHAAIDWNAYPDDNGRTVVASAAGTASLYYESIGGYQVIIDHGGGWQTVYAHLQPNGRVGGQVAAGQTIGFVGSTGSSTAPHLHWEQRLNGVRQVPLYANGVALNPGSSADQSAPAYTSNNCGLPSGFRAAFQANNGYLYTVNQSGASPTNQGMMVGTSPAIAPLSGGGHVIAFQANNGYLYVWTPSGLFSTGQGMKVGTSPAVTGLSNGGYQVAFQANNGYLYMYGSAGTFSTGQGMMAETSPSIAASSNGSYRVAFHANNGYLYTYDSSSGPASTGQGMRVATSPSIAPLSTGGYVFAFQANNGYLYLGGPLGLGSTGQGMQSGTSPAIATSTGGAYRAAFQANNGYLYVVDSSFGAAATDQGMMAGTSPSITALSSGGYEVAFQANNGYLYIGGPSGFASTGQGMMLGTSPSVTRG